MAPSLFVPVTNAVEKYGAPVNVSPFIRFSRWSLLFLGIAYGSLRHSFLQRRADKYKEIRHKRKAERLAKEAEAKKQKQIEGIRDLENILGAKIA